MKINDFKIGEKFYGSAGFTWLCTDKGTRTICAIMLEPDRSEVWFKGPPYMLNEKVFDEDEMSNCYTNLLDNITESLKSLGKTPSFLHEDVTKMMKEKFEDRNLYPKLYGNPAILRRDRVNPKHSILHPYSLTKINDECYIRTFDAFNCTYQQIYENSFINYPIAQSKDYEKAYILYGK